jgi:hypothetical protein
MKFPKMSKWVIVSGVVIWAAISIPLWSLFVIMFSGWENAQITHGEMFRLFQIIIFLPYFVYLTSLRFSFFEFFGVVILTPYIAIPLYWFILHQIDKTLKRRRGAKMAS